MRIRKQKNDRQHKRKKMTNKDLQNITQKTKDRVRRTPLKTGCELKGNYYEQKGATVIGDQ